jgi:hypothetical protein
MSDSFYKSVHNIKYMLGLFIYLYKYIFCFQSSVYLLTKVTSTLTATYNLQC